MLSHYHKPPQFLLFLLKRSRLTDLLRSLSLPHTPAAPTSSRQLQEEDQEKQNGWLCNVENGTLLKPGGLTAALLSHIPGRKLAGCTEGHL